MEKKKEPADIVISGEAAGYLHELFGMCTDDSAFSKTLDELFGSALFGEGHNGGEKGTTPNSVFREFHWHYTRIIDLKKVTAILYEAVSRYK